MKTKKTYRFRVTLVRPATDSRLVFDVENQNQDSLYVSNLIFQRVAWEFPGWNIYHVSRDK